MFAGERRSRCLPSAPGVIEMAAGESAYEMARRQREKAERLQRSAELWERGADGEAAVARALEALPEGWIVLHDLAWPGRQRANLDHVAVGPGGVFVIDAKNWSGRIEVRDQVLRQNGRQREEAVSSITAAAIAVQKLIAPVPCVGVLCFVRDEPLATSSWNVTVCSTTSLVAMLTARPHVLSPDDVSRCVEAVACRHRAHPDVRAAGRHHGRRLHRGGVRRSVDVATRSLHWSGAVVLMIALLSGGFEKAGGWVSDQLTAVIVPPPAEPAPTKPARQKKHQGEKKQQRERAGQ